MLLYQSLLSDGSCPRSLTLDRRTIRCVVCVGPSCAALLIGVNPSLHLVLTAHDLGLSLQASVPDDTVTVWPAHNTSWQSPCFTPEPDSQEPNGHQRMN